MLVGDGNNLKLSPPTGGVAPLKLMQNRSTQGFEFVTPVDDLQEFFPINAVPPVLDCANELDDCTQNIGQIGARYAHYPGWHQPFLFSWMHIDKSVWEGLSEGQVRGGPLCQQEPHDDRVDAVPGPAADDRLQREHLPAQPGRLREGRERSHHRCPVARGGPCDAQGGNHGPHGVAHGADGTGEAREFAIVYKAMHKVAGIPVAPGDLGPFPGESCVLESSSAS